MPWLIWFYTPLPFLNSEMLAHAICCKKKVVKESLSVDKYQYMHVPSKNNSDLFEYTWKQIAVHK